MILLDTNIISELMKPVPAAKVMYWLDKEEVTELFISTITIAEIAYGINALAKGRRKQSLEDAFYKAINESFKHRHLYFDENAAHAYGKLMAKRKEQGKPLSILDGQIAAIATVHGAAIATRNVKDFSNLNLELINPFG